LSTDSRLPLVSVVIPAYNCAHYLPAAIESALEQTHPNVEVVVVNDGSPDDTDEAVQPYLDRIIYFKQENQGLSAARNAGFRASTGEYVCFLDADDILLPDKFERQLAIFDCEPDLDVVISGYIDVEEDGRTEIRTVEKYWHRDGLEHLLNHEVFPSHAALIRREVLESSALFPEDIDTGESQEDWQLWLDLALDGVVFSSVPEPTCKYRHRTESISANPLRHLDGARRVVDWLRSDLRTLPILDRVERLAAIVELERVARAYQVGELHEAKETLARGLQTWPQFWQEPIMLLWLFKTTLTLAEQREWAERQDLALFEKRVIHEMLPAIGDTPADLQRLQATAYLMLSDLAYGMHDHRTRRRALRRALEYSLRDCLSSAGRICTLRGVLGPVIGGMGARFLKTMTRNASGVQRRLTPDPSI
jgi:glycosyltransferase involved in cell wall biosynthesis